MNDVLKQHSYPPFPVAVSISVYILQFVPPGISTIQNLNSNLNWTTLICIFYELKFITIYMCTIFNWVNVIRKFMRAITSFIDVSLIFLIYQYNLFNFALSLISFLFIIVIHPFKRANNISSLVFFISIESFIISFSLNQYWTSIFL